MAGDWVKLHRQTLDSQVFSDPAMWHLFCWCLLKTNWKTGWFQGVEVPAGSFATGREAAGQSLGMSGSAWYRNIKKLEAMGVIDVKANNRFTVISVVKWSFFQNGEQQVNNGWTTDEQPSNNHRTTSEQRVDTIEEGNKLRREEGKKERTISLSTDFDLWYLHYPKKASKNAAAKAYAKATKTIAPADLLAASLPRLRQLAKRDPQYIPNPATWLNSGGWQDDLDAIAPAAKSAFGPGQNYDPNHDYSKEVF